MNTIIYWKFFFTYFHLLYQKTPTHRDLVTFSPLLIQRNSKHNNIWPLPIFFNKPLETRFFREVPIYFWNCYSLRGAPRTKKAIKGWHHSLNAGLNRIQISFLLLVLKIRDKNDYLRAKFIGMELGQQFPRKRTYIRLEGSLESYLNFTGHRRYGVDFVFG